VFKSQEQLSRFITWAHRQGWSEQPQESLWLKQWRHNQLLRRNGSRLKATAEDIAAWYQQADSGELALDESGGWGSIR